LRETVTVDRTLNFGPDLPKSPRVRMQHRKLGEEVTRYLRDALVSGAYAHGTRLRIDEIAAQVGVSTMPVREALITLANEGLVEMLPRRGFRAAAIRQGEVRDSFRAGLLAEEAARVITQETVLELRALHEEFQRVSSGRSSAERSARLEQLNYVFHRTINWVPDSPRLRWFLRAATRYVPRHFYENIPGWIETSIHDHPLMLEAFERRASGKARQLMERHVQRAGELVLANLARRGRETVGD
jgi:DNA-binding GntR family transcriptional regulator